MIVQVHGHLVTCTPDEFKRLIELGLVDSPNATDTPQPSISEIQKLPDDIGPWPKGPSQQGQSTWDWVKKGTGPMPIATYYGCQVMDTPTYEYKNGDNPDQKDG